LALELIKKYKNKKIEVYPTNENVAIDGLINAKKMEFICKIMDDKKVIVSRKDYEYAIFKVLRDKLKTKDMRSTCIDFIKELKGEFAALIILDKEEKIF
jgi:glutamine phosphoribosylpyrophosphate amidotransferase